MSDPQSGRSENMAQGGPGAQSEADLAARRVLARLLWTIETGGKADKAGYLAERATYMAKANQVLRGLKRKGFGLTATEVADAAPDQD